MSWEGFWYQCYSEDGEQPYCRRLNRESKQMQWESAIDLAIAFAQGSAGYRQFHRTINLGGGAIVEEYWYWRPVLKFRADAACNARAAGMTLAQVANAAGYESAAAANGAIRKMAGWRGWWLIPERVSKRAMLLVKRATHCAIRRNGNGSCGPEDVVSVLEAWRNSGAWRKHAWGVSPHHDSGEIGIGKWLRDHCPVPGSRPAKKRRKAA